MWRAGGEGGSRNEYEPPQAVGDGMDIKVVPAEAHTEEEILRAMKGFNAGTKSTSKKPEKPSSRNMKAEAPPWRVFMRKVGARTPRNDRPSGGHRPE